jgi:hypothetical protein
MQKEKGADPMEANEIVPAPGRTRYILSLCADPNWPSEGLVPRPDILEIELLNDWGARISLEALPRAYNQTARGDRYYEIEAENELPAAGIRDTLARSIRRLKDPLFVGVPVRVILYRDNGSVISSATVHPGELPGGRKHRSPAPDTVTIETGSQPRP